MTAHACAERGCENPVAMPRADGRCYLHGKQADGLVDRPPRSRADLLEEPSAGRGKDSSRRKGRA